MDRRNFMMGSLAAGALAAAAQEGRAVEGSLSDGAVTADDYRALRDAAAGLLLRNRVTVGAGTFHVPSRDLYQALFGWDSGWHAIGMSRIDPAIAASELGVLVSVQDRDGRIPHEAQFSEIRVTPPLARRVTLWLVRSQFGPDGRSAMIDPPSYFLAAGRVFDMTRDREWLARILPPFERCFNYLTTARDLFGDGLVSVIHPWETGTDASPAFDEPLGIRSATALAAVGRGALYIELLDANSRFKWDPARSADKDRFVYEDVGFNAITIAGGLELARLCDELGEGGKASELRERAKAMMAALDRVSWDEEAGCYFSRYSVKAPKLSRRKTCASLLPLMTGLVPGPRAERMLAEHVLNPAEFWTEYLFPFNPADELEGEKIALEETLLWRGHCIWSNMNWMMNESLLQAGRMEEARELTRRTVRLIRREGFREFYDSRTGAGQGAANFNWPAVALDMVARTWPEAVS